ncbi:MAG: DUF5320 domain-containing protein [Cyanobacteriota bacterium]
MPRFDGTGPFGQGSRTGREFGYCVTAERGFPVGRGRQGRNFAYDRGPDRGRGMGRRAGRSFGGYLFTPPQPQEHSKEHELALLKSALEELKKETETINNRISELEKEE